MRLPQPLRTEIDNMLQSWTPKRLAPFVEKLSRAYRSDNRRGDRIVHQEEEAVAYAAFRLPATFAAITAALHQVRVRLPQFSPRSAADVGAGPGTGMWAATTVWPEIETFHLFEREKAMIQLGQRFARPLSPARQIVWQRTDVEQLPSSGRYDLVMAAYVAGELRQDNLDAFVEGLWRIHAGVIVIIEPGTPKGFTGVNQMRERLRALGARIIAPCPHSEACPLPTDDWCHFSQRLERSVLHRRVKGGELPYEDEKFSYLAVSRFLSPEPITARIVRHPQIRKGHIRLALCTRDGFKQSVITRKQKEQFRRAKDYRWGSAISNDTASTDLRGTVSSRTKHTASSKSDETDEAHVGKGGAKEGQ